LGSYVKEFSEVRLINVASDTGKYQIIRLFGTGFGGRKKRFCLFLIFNRIMSASDLKSLLHDQIERLQREENLQDLLLTVNEFVNYQDNAPR